MFVTIPSVSSFIIYKLSSNFEKDNHNKIIYAKIIEDNLAARVFS